VVVIWGVLMALEIREPQAYIFPVGLALLSIGWNERRHGRNLQYQGCTVLGMAVLMGSAFVQSLGTGNWPYALLLTAESAVAMGWGVWRHLKRCVQVGGLALLANAIAQLGPAFVELSGWIQLGLIGSLLLGGGILALLKREELLAARQRLTTEWGTWEP
jgi:membrane protein implicated in regulation of membrane protease activity